MKQDGRGLFVWIWRRIGIEKPESYPGNGTGFFGTKSAKSRRHQGAQLFFHSLSDVVKENGGKSMVGWLLTAIVYLFVFALPAAFGNSLDEPAIDVVHLPNKAPQPPALWFGPPESTALQANADSVARELVIHHWINPLAVPASWLVDPMDPNLFTTIREKLHTAEQTYFELDVQKAGALYAEAFGILRRDPRCMEQTGSDADLSPARLLDHAGLAYRIFTELGSTVAAQSLLRWVVTTFPTTALNRERHPPEIVQLFAETTTTAKRRSGRLRWTAKNANQNCQLWLNGVERTASSPVDLAEGDYLASVRCPNGVGWYRAIQVGAGQETILVAVPELEEKLRRGPYGLRMTDDGPAGLGTSTAMTLESLGVLAETINTTAMVFDGGGPTSTPTPRAIWVRPAAAPCVFAVQSQKADEDGLSVRFPADCLPIDLSETAAATPIDPGAMHDAGWSLFGIGLAGLVAGGIVHILHSRHVSAEDPPTSDSAVTQETRLQSAATGLYIGGAATVATGITLLIVDTALSADTQHDQLSEKYEAAVGVSFNHVWLRFEF
ncbi:MAG: hypothetical protein HUU55_14245 [Myxococcales bacterium]|nr:hypothetical protein [Myxococcales bacterium]